MLPRNKLTQRNLAVFAAGVVTFLNLYCTQAILTVLASQFHTSPLRTGLTVTTPLLAVAMIAPLIGAISDRFGRRRLIVSAAMLLILPTLLAATAQTLGQMILWRFLQGLLLPFILKSNRGARDDGCLRSPRRD
ncbi:MAG TPA: MFS transporter [Acetobacteraceae bacterium]|nr:MFS transporter [Acetobacteraceae bacterium]